MRKPPSPIPISCIESQLYPEQVRLPASRMIMEMAKEVPEVRFDVISLSSGLEAIERARADVVDLC